MKNRFVAVFFAFFGGVVGLHKMYLRGWNAGSGRLVFFFLAIFLRWPVVLVILTVIAILEGILMATMDQETFDQKYNSVETAAPRSTRAERHQKRAQRRSTRSAPRPAAIFSGAGKFIKNGMKKFRNYDLKGALADFLQAEERDPRSATVHFNLACTYSMMENAEKGFHHLSLAMTHGFRDEEKIQTHDSLAFLRIQPDFRAFVANGYKPLTEHQALESGGDGNLLEELRKLSEQREQGMLTSEEFDMRKRNLFG
ncbi:MAG: SHOCT domain-containing protein [Saprospiraceae bacterium]|nr:SHOCT domain-containing protein [Saprospiraceae bacterium]